ncbi:hypothetical protein VaNZ11_005252 [Volvox africanus]|uniref:Uncharacterized protein n=1 Tax=Volvox africanus TaxID=51714 RepID=A0ABQ5RZE5_9CHLO|nr:hypothetical protein VaNZ11_005252 [Volvox africanus]
MASSQGQQQPSQSPFKLLSRVGWGSRNKKPKQGSLGEENNMYYHPELKRWVEKGKESEAEREAAGPPPPPVVAGGNLTTASFSKRSLSQRYVLQPNLSISSSMASLAGSLSQTDLAGLAGAGQWDSFSGPPSAMGSTAPSPPQSGRELTQPASFGPSAPISSGSLFLVPGPPQRASSQPSGGNFFIPKPLTKGDAPSPEGALPPEAPSDQLQGDAVLPSAAFVSGNGRVSPVPEADANDEDPMAVANGHVKGSDEATLANQLTNSVEACTDVPINSHDSATLDDESSAAAIENRALECSVSFSDTLKHHQVDSPSVLSSVNSIGAAGPMTEDQQQQLSPLTSRGSRRFAGAVANASDGGAAISLHDGMGVTPVRSHVYHHNSGEGDRAAINGGELAAVEEGDTAADSSAPPADSEAAGALDGQAAGLVANGDSMVVEANDAGQAVEVKNNDAGRADAATTGPSDGGVEGSGCSAWHSQYYYQQYAYLYQYALGMGYGEADAVTYAQYYAATYAQQYEAQTPEGNIGGDAHTGDAAPDTQEQQQQQQLAVIGVAMDSTGAAALAEVVETAAKPPWQAAAGSAEDEAYAVVGGSSLLVEDKGRSEDPVYVTAPHVSHSSLQFAPFVSGSFVPEPMVDSGDVGRVTAAPLPVDLTVAANAAAQHHQSAVTAAVAAAAAAVEEQRRVSRSGIADGAGLVPSSIATTDNAAGPLGGSLAPQLLRGLGAAGAKRLTQLSSAVASLGATVAATAPVAAALSAATAAASTAAAAAGGFVDMADVVGLSEEDFDRIMHPGDPAKLDGPLPWELPEHLRTGRKFLALCANWQLRNPGQQYTPQLLLQLQEQQMQQQQHQQQQQTADVRVVASQIPPQGAEMVVAVEDGSGSTCSAGPLVEADLSSYERACRLAQFGQPATGLLLSKDAKQATRVDSSLREPQCPPQQQPIVANGEVFVIAAHSGPNQDVREANPATSVPESASTAVVDTQLCLRVPMTMSTPPDRHPTPDLARSDGPSVGIEPAPPSQPLLQQPCQQDSPFHAPNSGIAPGQERSSKAGERAVPLGLVEASGTSTEVCSLARLGTVEATSFFDRLGEQTPVGKKPEVLSGPAPEQQIPGAAAPREKQEEVVAAATKDSMSDSEVAAPAAAAAAAIDSVVQALEQLRNSAAASNGGAVTEPLAGTALLLQIQSSLALATEALAGMGVDVSALTSLAVAPRLQTPITPAEWTPSASHKRPRVEASPTTPTRVAAVGATTECVATPVLAPGPPVARPVVEAPTVVSPGTAVSPGPGERFQQLGKRLSDASSEASGLGVSQSQSRLVQLQQPSVMLSLNLTATQEVDLAAIEERLRVEERTSWEARLDAVVDSEREAAALVIAAVERERDGLQQRAGELETALTSLKAERDGLVLRLEVAEAACRQAKNARGEAEVEREAMAAKLSEIVVERDTLADALAMERSEKAVLAETLSSVRVESEDLRKRYTERFSALSSELEATRDSLAALQGEHDELLLCLGQESTKVAVLTDALRDAGSDPEPLIEQIENEYATMELGRTGDDSVGDQGAATGGGEQLQSLDDAEKGWEGEDLQL